MPALLYHGNSIRFAFDVIALPSLAAFVFIVVPSLSRWTLGRTIISPALPWQHIRGQTSSGCFFNCPIGYCLLLGGYKPRYILALCWMYFKSLYSMSQVWFDSWISWISDPANFKKVPYCYCFLQYLFLIVKMPYFDCIICAGTSIGSDFTCPVCGQFPVRGNWDRDIAQREFGCRLVEVQHKFLLAISC